MSEFFFTCRAYNCKSNLSFFPFFIHIIITITRISRKYLKIDGKLLDI